MRIPSEIVSPTPTSSRRIHSSRAWVQGKMRPELPQRTPHWSPRFFARIIDGHLRDREEDER